MTDIKRFNVGYMGLEEHPKGRYVAHGDYLDVVKGLEARITTLENLLSEAEESIDYWSDRAYD